MVNLEWYRSFKAIYKTGTLTGAAQELLISQPNVSQHLSALESHVGKQLFERKPRKMIPTDYGKLFYTQIIEAMEKLEQVESQFRYTRTSEIPLTCIGTSKEFFYSVMSPKINDTVANLVFEFGPVNELMEKLLKGRLYFVVTTVCLNESGIVYEPLFKEDFSLIAARGFNTKKLDDYVVKGETDNVERFLNEQEWYAYSSDLDIVRRFWLDNFQKRPTIKPRFIIPDYNALLKSVSHGKGITVAGSLLTADLIQQHQLKKIWNGNGQTTNTIYLAYDKNNVTTDQIKMVTGMLKS